MVTLYEFFLPFLKIGMVIGVPLIAFLYYLLKRYKIDFSRARWPAWTLVLLILIILVPVFFHYNLEFTDIDEGHKTAILGLMMGLNPYTEATTYRIAPDGTTSFGTFSYPPLDLAIYSVGWLSFGSLFPNFVDLFLFVNFLFYIATVILLLYDRINPAATILLAAINIPFFHTNIMPAIFFTILFYHFYKKGSFTPATISLAAAALVKFIPILILPFYMQKIGWKRNQLILFVAVLLLASLQFGMLNVATSTIGFHTFRNPEMAIRGGTLLWEGLSAAGLTSLYLPLFALLMAATALYIYERRSSLIEQHNWVVLMFLMLWTVAVPDYLGMVLPFIALELFGWPGSSRK